MANTKLQVVDKLKPFAPMLRALLDGMDELAKLGSLDQAGDEAQARVDSLRKQEEDLKTSVDWHKATLAAVQQDTNTKKAESERKASEYDRDLETLRATQRKTLDNEALAARAVATADAKSILDKASGDAANTVAIAQRKADEHEARATAALSLLDQINSDVRDAEARHAELMRHIESLKAKFA